MNKYDEVKKNIKIINECLKKITNELNGKTDYDIDLEYVTIIRCEDIYECKDYKIDITLKEKLDAKGDRINDR